MSDDNLNEELRRWRQPTELGRWVRLPLSDKDVEVLGHTNMRKSADERHRARDLWPEDHVMCGINNLRAAVARINATASQLTGKPGAVIQGPGIHDSDDRPQLRLRLLTDVPHAEVWLDETPR